MSHYFSNICSIFIPFVYNLSISLQSHFSTFSSAQSSHNFSPHFRSAGFVLNCNLWTQFLLIYLFFSFPNKHKSSWFVSTFTFLNIFCFVSVLFVLFSKHSKYQNIKLICVYCNHATHFSPFHFSPSHFHFLSLYFLFSLSLSHADISAPCGSGRVSPSLFVSLCLSSTLIFFFFCFIYLFYHLLLLSSKC